MKLFTTKQALMPVFALPPAGLKRRFRATVNSIEKTSLRFLNAGLLITCLLSLFVFFTVQPKKQEVTHSSFSTHINAQEEFLPVEVNKTQQFYPASGVNAVGNIDSKNESFPKQTQKLEHTAINTAIRNENSLDSTIANHLQIDANMPSLRQSPVQSRPQQKSKSDTTPTPVSEFLDIWLVARPPPGKQIFVALTALLASTQDLPFINVQTLPRIGTKTANYFTTMGHLRERAKIRETLLPRTNVTTTVYDRMTVGAALAGSQANENLEGGSRRGLLLLHDDMVMRPHGLEKLLLHINRIEQVGLQEYVLDCGSMSAKRTATTLPAIARLTANYGPNKCLYIPIRLVPFLSQRFESLNTTDPTPASRVIAGWLAEQPLPLPWLSLLAPIGRLHEPTKFH